MPIPSTLLKSALLLAVLAVPAVETGSWFITRVQLEDDAASAAVVAADAVQGSPVSAQTAKAALVVAQQELGRSGGGAIDPASLRLFDDGTLRFTAHRSAPSLLLGRFDRTKDVMDVSVQVEGGSID